MSPAGDRGTSGQGPSGLEFLGIGFLIAAAVVVPLLLGAFVDSVRHSAPAFVLIGLLLGVIIASVAVYTRFKRYL
jgi:F0F1-type ATP synthase assembly protein I